MTGEPPFLDPDEKVDLWRQRFFEAQAAAEEFVLGEHGEEGLAAWIQANSRITAELLRAQRPAGVSATDHFMTRLRRQLLLYDSAVTSEARPSGTVLRNTDCGILRYRKRAARDRMVESLATGDVATFRALASQYGVTWLMLRPPAAVADIQVWQGTLELAAPVDQLRIYRVIPATR